MKYIITFRQYTDNSKPLVLAKTIPSTDKLKVYLDTMEAYSDTYELLSIVPIKEG